MPIRSHYVAMTLARDDLALIGHDRVPASLRRLADAPDLFDVQVL